MISLGVSYDSNKIRGTRGRRWGVNMAKERTSGPQWSPPKTTMLKEDIMKLHKSKKNENRKTLNWFSRGSFKKGGMRVKSTPPTPRSAPSSPL